MISQGSNSIPGLFGDAMGQLAKLVGLEFALAKAELADKASKAGVALGLIGASAVLMIPALVVLLLAVAAGLTSAGLSQPIAYFIAGGGAALVAAALLAVGVSRLSPRNLKPNATLHQLEKDKAAAKEMVR